jgi:diaminopimelate dehydrogenase
MVQQGVYKSEPSGEAMPKLQVAVIGLGRLGLACADALIDESELGLAGVVRRPGSPAALPGRLQRFPVASHVRELEGVRAVLVCVPADAVLGVARELLQARIPVVECACFEGKALEAHHAALGEAADNHRVAAVVGAGWDPGILPLMRSAFEMLIPRGHTVFHRHPGLSLHHTAAVAGVSGVKGALAGEYRGDNGASQHYVYVELERGAELAQVQAASAADPLFAGEVLQVFQVAHLSEMEGEDGFGVVLDRRGSATHGPHQSLLLEARFDPTAFSARIMLDAARKLPALRRGAHRYAIGL